MQRPKSHSSSRKHAGSSLFARPRVKLALAVFLHSLVREGVAIETELLKGERDKLRDVLRDTEAQVRKVEADLKGLRQREIQTKREIEALSTLIEIKEHREVKAEGVKAEGAKAEGT